MNCNLTIDDFAKFITTKNLTNKFLEKNYTDYYNAMNNFLDLCW